MTIYIFDFDSKAAKLSYREDDSGTDRLLWSVSRNQDSLSLSEEGFFIYLALELEMIFSTVKGKKLVLRGMLRDRRRLDRHLSDRIRKLLIRPSEPGLAA